MCELVSSDLLSVCKVYVIIFKYEHPQINIDISEWHSDRIIEI